MSKPPYHLVEEIVNLSVSDTWDKAKHEWSLQDIYIADEFQTCICTHYPIREICVISNRRNGEVTEVGNVCVKRFLGLPSGKLFDAISRVMDDISASLNADVINHAFDRGWINEWEADFYIDIWRKRKLTEKQWAKKERINRKVLHRVMRAKAESEVTPQE